MTLRGRAVMPLAAHECGVNVVEPGTEDPRSPGGIVYFVSALNQSDESF